MALNLRDLNGMRELLGTLLGGKCVISNSQLEAYGK